MRAGREKVPTKVPSPWEYSNFLLLGSVKDTMIIDIIDIILNIYQQRWYFCPTPKKKL